MKKLVIGVCLIVAANAVSSLWEAFKIERHIKHPKEDIDDFFKVTLIKTNNQNESSYSDGEEVYENENNVKIDLFDNIIKQFDVIGNKIDQLMTTKDDGKNDACERISRLGNNTKTVFVLDAPIDNNCTYNIVRASIANSGPVTVFGISALKSNVYFLDFLMGMKDLVYDEKYELPKNLSEKFANYSYRGYIPAKDFSSLMEDSVRKSDYNRASQIAQSLEKNNNFPLIQGVVRKLFEESNEKLISFAYKLWENNSRVIIKKCFPTSLYKVLNAEEVLLVYKRDYGRIGLSTNFTQQDLDRDVYTDCSRNQSLDLYWTFEPIWAKNKVTFKIWNPFYEKYLKIQQEAEKDGSRVPWGGTNEWYIPGRFIWNLVPIKSETKEPMYCFVNVEHNQALTSGTCTSEKVNVIAKSKPCTEENSWFIADKDFKPEKYYST